MKKSTKQLSDWYNTVQDEDQKVRAWANEVTTDPENSIVFTRLANCAARTVEMMLKLAEMDADPSTRQRVRDAMLHVLEK